MNRSTLQGTKPSTMSVFEWSITCLSCGIDGDRFTDPGEATYLAGVHNDLHHGRRLDAFVVRIHTKQGIATLTGGAR